METNSETHPYIHGLRDGLKERKKIVELLNKRIELLPTTGTPYELNEYEITRIMTSLEIKARQTEIDTKEKYFNDYIKQFEGELKECEANYISTLKKAEAQRKFNTKIDCLLKSVDFSKIDKSIESKVDFYKRLKQNL